MDAVTARDRVGARNELVARGDTTFNCVLVFATMLLHVVRVILSRKLSSFDLRDDLIWCWMVFGFSWEWDVNCNCLVWHESRFSCRKQVFSSRTSLPGASHFSKLLILFSIANLDQLYFNLLSQPLFLKMIFFSFGAKFFNCINKWSSFFSHKCIWPPVSLSQ